MSKFVGEIFTFATTPPPAGAVECGGQALDRVKYADLFRVIGTRHGAGNGSTTFNVPNCAGRVIASPNLMGGIDSNVLHGQPGGSDGILGSLGGEEQHVLTESEVAILPIVVANDSTSEGTSCVRGGDGVNRARLDNVVNESGSGSHNNIQPTIILPACIWTGVFA